MKIGWVENSVCGFMDWQFCKDMGGYNAKEDSDGSGAVFEDMFSDWLFNHWWRNEKGEYTFTAQLRADYMNN